MKTKAKTKAATPKKRRWKHTTASEGGDEWTCKTNNLQVRKVVTRSGGLVFVQFEASTGAAVGDIRHVRGICPELAQALRLAAAPPCWKCGFGHLLRLQPHPWHPYYFRIRCNGDLCDSTQSGESSEFRPLDEALARWEDLPNARARETKLTQLFVMYLNLFLKTLPQRSLMRNYLYGPDETADELQQFVFAQRRPGLERQGTMAISILEAARQLADAEHHVYVG